MTAFFHQWHNMTGSERFQYTVEVWALVTLGALLILFGLAFAAMSGNPTQIAMFGSALAGRWLGFGCLVSALSAPLLLPYRERLTVSWKRRLFIFAFAPMLFYMIVVVISVTRGGMLSAGVISYALTFNLLCLIGVTLYRHAPQPERAA